MPLSKKVVAAYVGVFVLFLSAYLFFKTSVVSNIPSQLELIPSKNAAISSMTARIIPTAQSRLQIGTVKSERDQSNEASNYHPPPPLSSNDYKPLTREEIDGVETFVLFIGYARSGHSIIGSMMDAHPDMMIAHEYFIFKKWNEQKKVGVNLLNKDKLFNELYKESFSDQSKGLRTAGSTTKGYTLQIKESWQGRFQNLRVIGDKSGGTTALIFHGSPQITTKHFQEMTRTVGIPIKFFHIIRNPYDIIATEALYRDGPNHSVKSNYNETHKMDNSDGLWFAARYLFDCVSAVQQMKRDWRLTSDNLLEIYTEDFLTNPKPVIQRICSFLKLDCPAEYVQQCYDKTYKKISRTRDRVLWPTDLREWIEKSMKKYDFLKGYSFDRNGYRHN